jgi:uridine kinase
MKISLLISGYLRGLYENIDSIKENIIQNNDCDIYIHITSSYKDDKYINKELSLDFINEKLKPKLIIINGNFKFSKDNNTNNILNQNYKFYLLNEERKKIMKIENITYNIVIKIRPDVHFFYKLEFENLDPYKIYIPIDSKIDINKLKNLDDKHICDIIAYGNSEVMDKYLNYYNYINELIEKYNSIINETLLYYYLYENNIQYDLVDIKYYVILSLCNTIAITGDSGTGKTTISNILKEIFNNGFILECDRYHKWERNNEHWNKYTHLDPSSNYITKMQKDVFDLKIGKNIYQIDYDHIAGKFTDNKLIESKENIIVCGLHSLYLPKEILNLKIYMDTDDNLRIPWKIKRDIKKRGYSIDKILEQIKNREIDFKKFIYPQKKEADIIICLFTDKIFDINTFSINEDLNIYLKIGIKVSYNINNILHKLKINKIVKDEHENILYLYFDNINDYDNIIKTIILNYY